MSNLTRKTRVFDIGSDCYGSAPTRLHATRRQYGGCRRGQPRYRRAQEGLAAVPVGGGGAWPGFEPTRRAKLAARTASGRAAAHGHIEQPGPRDGTCGARNTSSATSNKLNREFRLRRRCGGRRRVRRARAGFEIDHSEPQARVWRSRGQPDPTTPGTPAAPQATQQQAPPQQRPGIQKTDIRIGCRPVVELGGFEPPTFSLRTRRATNCAIAPRTRTA